MNAQTTDTLDKHVRQAYEFFIKNDVWIAVGRSTPWPDEENPPAPAFTSAALDEIMGLVKPDPLKMAVPDPEGEIEMYAQRFRGLPLPTSLEDALDAGARWVYVAGWLMYDQFPVVTFRQEGVFSGVVLNEGVPPGATVLLPEQVQSYGILEAITNREKIERRDSQKNFVEFVIEF